MDATPTPQADVAPETGEPLASLIELRRATDAKLAWRRRNRPNDKIGIVTLEARKNGIQACINEVVAERYSPHAGWIRTAERAPTQEDADKYGNVFTLSGLTLWHNVNKRRIQFWMKIPPVPEASSTPVEAEAK